MLSSSTLQSLLMSSLSESRKLDMASAVKVWIVVRNPLMSRFLLDLAVSYVLFGNSTEKGINNELIFI